jgi:hypothetical protein
MEQVRQPATKSRFYDKDAPSTSDKRERARENSVMFCRITYGETKEETMFATATLIDHVCPFIEGMARILKGKLQEKVKISTLIHYRQGLEWWIRILTPSFATIKAEFKSRVTCYTYMIAQKHELSIKNREKNNLGEFELQLFFDQIMLENKRVAI